MPSHFRRSNCLFKQRKKSLKNSRRFLREKEGYRCPSCRSALSYPLLFWMCCLYIDSLRHFPFNPHVTYLLIIVQRLISWLIFNWIAQEPDLQSISCPLPRFVLLTSALPSSTQYWAAQTLLSLPCTAPSSLLSSLISIFCEPSHSTPIHLFLMCT